MASHGASTASWVISSLWIQLTCRHLRISLLCVTPSNLWSWWHTISLPRLIWNHMEPTTTMAAWSTLQLSYVRNKSSKIIQIDHLRQWEMFTKRPFQCTWWAISLFSLRRLRSHVDGDTPFDSRWWITAGHLRTLTCLIVVYGRMQRWIPCHRLYRQW